MTNPKTDKPKTKKTAATKPTNNNADMMQSLRDRVQAQSQNIAQQKQKLVDASLKQKELLEKHKQAMNALKKDVKALEARHSKEINAIQGSVKKTAEQAPKSLSAAQENKNEEAVQNLRERVQKQSKAIAQQKETMLATSLKQKELLENHKQAMTALKQDMKTLKKEQDEISTKAHAAAQKNTDRVKKEASQNLIDIKSAHRKKVEEMASSKLQALDDAHTAQKKVLEEYQVSRKERIEKLESQYDARLKNLKEVQKQVLKDIKDSNTEQIALLKTAAAEQMGVIKDKSGSKILQANQEIARLSLTVSNFENTDQDKTTKQLLNTRKMLEDKSVELEIREQQLISVQHYLDNNIETKSGFSLDGFILKLLSVGYQRYARIHYLDLITESDWKGLLACFKSKKDGFKTLEAMRPIFAPWVQHYHALIDVIHDRGFTVRSMEDYYENGYKDKSVYMYHDVHAWDIMPALGMALANKDRGICTTFLLNIDQAQIDLSHEAGYRIFGTLTGKNVQPGLHANPFATWMRMDVFKGDEQAFMTWVSSKNAVDELLSLLDEKRTPSGPFAQITKEDAKKATLKQLDQCFQKLKTFRPDANSSSHHGDVINKLYQSIDFKKISDCAFVHTPALLRNQMARDCGILVSPTSIQESRNFEIKIYSEGPNNSKYYENLHKVLDGKESALLINHPGAISNAGLTLNMKFVAGLKDSQFEKYAPVDPPLQSPSQMLATSKNTFDIEY